jgi:hypothetical protein
MWMLLPPRSPWCLMELSIHMDVFNRALKEQDYAALEGLYAGDYMLVRPDGSVLNKGEVLQDLRSGGLRFHSVELGQTKVRIVRTFD